MSCSNLFSSAATRFASRDLMASWEWKSWTTLQITVLSSSLVGIFFDAIEVFPPSTTMLTIAKRMDRTRRQTTMERILSSDDFTSFRIAFENVVKSLWLAVFLDCLYMCTVYNRLLWSEHKIFSCQLLLPITLSHFVVYSRFRCCCNWSTSKLGLSLQNGSGQKLTWSKFFFKIKYFDTTKTRCDTIFILLANQFHVQMHRDCWHKI